MARIIPFQDGMKLGFGYDLITGNALTSRAVEGTISAIQDARGQTVTSHNVRIDDIDTLHQTIGVNVDAGGSYFGASVDVKVDYAKECNVSTHSTHILVGVSVQDAFENFDNPVLSQDANELLKTGDSARFRQRFGDVFIDGILRGGEYFATYEIASIDESARENIAVAVQGSFNSGLAAAHLDVSITNETATAHGHTEVRVHVFQKGAVANTDQGFEEIMAKAHTFPPSVAGDLAAPFAVSLAEYKTLKLPNDGFDFLQIENQRDVLAEHARKRFAFLKLLNDISYIRRHPEDFVGADLDKLAAQFAKVTDAINLMEKEASACLRNATACSFTPFDVSDFPLPKAARATLGEDDLLAAKGEGIANLDPLAILIRDQPGFSRRGFDIGLAAADGQTLPGPGKDAKKESLILADRDAFQEAVDFSLDRNRNPDLAARGAAVVKVDQAVADERSKQPLGLAWLGFNIATGLFGRAPVAQGHTQEGPGSQAIRDALSADGQKGFRAAVAFHLGRAA